jgi:pyruvate dehydrogenase E2 component (dihydrolipoamide acetyltransferase)
MDVPARLWQRQEMTIKVGDRSPGHTDPDAGHGQCCDGDRFGRCRYPAIAAAAAAPGPAARRQKGTIDEAAFAPPTPVPAQARARTRRRLGVVKGSGQKGRIPKEDIDNFRQGRAGRAAAACRAASVATIPCRGRKSTSQIRRDRNQTAIADQRISANLHRNWVMIPHVTNHDDADITDLEAFRVQLNKENEKRGVKVSMLAFMIKAAVATLKKFPEFNASLDGDNLVLKKYYHIGFAADTPQGLVVPVIRDADKKGVIDIAKEMGDLAKLARDGKLKPDQMQGGCFTISSLGGVGGIYFTPIINAPEVAIMGVCRSFWKQVSTDGKTSSWRFMLPLSLSWDHRVIDGASAARFNNHFAGLLADMRRVLI